MPLFKSKLIKYPAAALALLILLSGAWLLRFSAAYSRDNAFISSTQTQLSAIAESAESDRSEWQIDKLSSEKLAANSSKRMTGLRAIIEIIQNTRLLKCDNRRAANLLLLAYAALNHDFSSWNCARASLMPVLGREDDVCHPYNPQDTHKEIQAAKAALPAPAGLLSAAAAEIRARLSRPRKNEKPNVIIILLDAARRDDLYANAPFISKLSKEGLRFDNALAPSSFTQTSVATLLTGVAPYTHGLVSYNAWRNDLLVSRVFKSAGWKTSAFASNSLVWPRMQFGNGFDRFFRTFWLPGEAAVNEASSYIASGMDPRKPQFMYFHLIDPHATYFSPDAFKPGARLSEWPPAVKPGLLRKAFTDKEIDARGHVTNQQLDKMKNNYGDEIAYADKQVEQLFSALRRGGLLDNSLVIITSDHGEEFLEHGGVEHSHTLYRESVEIPLVLWGNIPPQWRKAYDKNRPVSLIDIAPTILDFAGIPLPSYLQGKNIFKGRPDKYRYMVVEGVAPGTLSDKCVIGAVQRANMKLVACYKDSIYQLFDLAKDPGETRNIAPAPENTGALTELNSAFIRWRSVTGKNSRPGKTMLDPNTLKQLKSLGYIK